MAMDGLNQTSMRDANGRFLPGQSGNPAGKKPGTRNRATVLREALAEGEDIAAARIVIDKALAGDAVAARFVVGRLMALKAARRERLSPIHRREPSPPGRGQGEGAWASSVGNSVSAVGSPHPNPLPEGEGMAAISPGIFPRDLLHSTCILQSPEGARAA